MKVPRGGRLERKDKGVRKTVLVPDGLGALVKARVSDLQAKNLRPAIRFSEALHGAKSRFSKPNHNLLKQLEGPNPPPFHKSQYDIPAQQTLAALKIAQAADVSLADVLALLVAYGLEYLSQELRMTGSAPTPKDPRVEVKTYSKPPTPRDEFYKSKGLATTERKTTVHELTGNSPVSHVQYGGQSQGTAEPAVPGVPATKQTVDSSGVQPQLQHKKQQGIGPVVPPVRDNSFWHIPKSEL
jgi:hypothetical protein